MAEAAEAKAEKARQRIEAARKKDEEMMLQKRLDYEKRQAVRRLQLLNLSQRCSFLTPGCEEEARGVSQTTGGRAGTEAKAQRREGEEASSCFGSRSEVGCDAWVVLRCSGFRRPNDRQEEDRRRKIIEERRKKEKHMREVRN